MSSSPLPPPRAIWCDGAEHALTYIDQRGLPETVVHGVARDAGEIADAIDTSALAGQGLIGIAAAFGAALAREQAASDREAEGALERLRIALAGASRASGANGDSSGARAPQATRIDHGTIERVLAAAHGAEWAAAQAILDHQLRIDRGIVRHAAARLASFGSILTNGSSGALATGGAGTALGAIIAIAGAQRLDVVLCETRPLQTGRRLAAFECAAAGIAFTVIPDAAAAGQLRSGTIDAVIVGGLTMAANGDVVAEIGTYGIALAAAQHRVPFYVALPRAAIDFTTARYTPERCAGATSTTEMTPGHLIGAVFTEYGIMQPPYDESLRGLATRPDFAALNDR